MTLTAPATVKAGQQFIVTGEGYDPAKQTWILVESVNVRGYWNAEVSLGGELMLKLSLSEPGTTTLSSETKNRVRSKTLAKTTVEVT